VAGGCDIDKFQKPLFEGQLTEDLLGLSAVEAGGLNEHDHLPRLDFGIHKLLSHAGDGSVPGRNLYLQVLLGVLNLYF
jgi:hypothetical protein